MAVDIALTPVPGRQQFSLGNIAWARSLRGRLILALLVVGIVPMVLVAGLAFRKQHLMYVGLEAETLKETAYGAMDTIDRNFFERYGDVQLQAQTAIVQSMDPASLRTHLDSVVKIYSPSYVLIAVADANGKLIATSTIDAEGRPLPVSRLEGRDVSAEPWFRDAVSGSVADDKPLVGDLRKDPLLTTIYGDGTAAWATTFTAPIKRDGRIVGVLRTFCNWAVVREILNAAVARSRDESTAAGLLLLDSKGTILHSDDPAHFATLNLAGNELVAKAIRPNVTGSGVTDGLAGSEELLAGYRSSNGFSSFPGLAWTVIATEPMADAYKHFFELVQGTLILALLVSLAVFIGALLLARRFTRPLRLMGVTLENLASQEADLSRRLPDGDDEIGRVSRWFNVFIDNLQTLVQQVIRSGMQVTMSTTQIAAGAKQLEATVSEQVAATNEVVATSNEIAATADDLEKTMSAVSRMSEETTSAATRGQRDLQQMEASVSRMEEATQAVSARLAVINDKAGNISTVVTTITKVADQTNLLSLNAAIEAEKAGQFGQGFAVVAREIRRLADQTAVATLDIEKMVKEMKSAVSSGVMSMEKLTEQVRQSVAAVTQVGSQLNVIIEKVQEVTPKFESAHIGMQAQLQGAQQISEAMGQLSETTQQTALALRDTNRAISDLNSAAGSLQSMFSRFKLNVA